MSLNDGVFNNLRQKLDVLGYRQSLPLAAIPLVGALFEDLVKSTESLRDSKKETVHLLEEKSCWELGVEPYKCDNSRLLAECNQLHQQMIREHEDFEQKISDFNRKIRNLKMDKERLEEHCQNLQQQLTAFVSKPTDKSSDLKNLKEPTAKAKKPFITTVRSGEMLPSKKISTENINNLRCTKCSEGCYQQGMGRGTASKFNGTIQVVSENLDSKINDLNEQLSLCMRKIEARDREICRLNDLLLGGRPVTALAKECCYKDVNALKEDIDLLQKEKSENFVKIREYQDQMHEAMQRALILEEHNKKLQRELETFKSAALQVESQANAEIEQKDSELDILKRELRTFQNNCANMHQQKYISKNTKNGVDDDCETVITEKRDIKERLNELTQRESELHIEYDRLEKKIRKLKIKNSALEKELKENARRKQIDLDEEKIRLKSERDFFQKEYLQLVSKTGSEKEIEFMQSQVRLKDEELRALRSELYLRQPVQPSSRRSEILVETQYTSRASNVSSESSEGCQQSSHCVQAAALRIERERSILIKDLERVRIERDALKEKIVCMTHLRTEDIQKYQMQINELSIHIQQLERKNRELTSTQLPTETQIVLLKEEIDELKGHNRELQTEHTKLKSIHDQLRILHEQTQRTLVDCQNKLALTSHQLDKADMNLNVVNSNRESMRDEAAQLHSEVTALKKTYLSLENEKDKLLSQLDIKTEKVYKLEYELKKCTEKCERLEEDLIYCEDRFKKLQSKYQEQDSKLDETSSESKSLRQQIVALKVSRDEAISENGRLTNELAESQAEILTLKKKLRDSETEIERLKQQLRQYVQEVKKAEDLLLHKEKEREEMLEHYRSLSHDAVLLEGNNQSLEVEAAEHKRQICELEADIETLKKDICCRNEMIEQLEDRLSTLNAQNNCLEGQLDEAIDEQRLLKVDLAARKELCGKLDVEKDKLNVELQELNEIRRKLEKDNEQLRNDLENNLKGNKTSTETLDELLSKTRRDLEDQIKTDSKLSQELVRMRQQNEALLLDLQNERQKRLQHETLAHEYHIQNQELRHNMTDDRFRQARTREQSPRFPSQTM